MMAVHVSALGTLRASGAFVTHPDRRVVTLCDESLTPAGASRCCRGTPHEEPWGLRAVCFAEFGLQYRRHCAGDVPPRILVENLLSGRSHTEWRGGGS